MCAVVLADPLAIGKGVGVGAGVAHELVAHPTARLVAMAERAEEFAELRLVLVQRQAAGIADDGAERGAERRILRR